MRKLATVMAALMLGGCASVPSAKLVAPQRATIATKQIAKPVEQPTPNQTVKRRWFKGFKIKLLHDR